MYRCIDSELTSIAGGLGAGSALNGEREGPSPLAISAKRRSSGSEERERHSPLAVSAKRRDRAGNGEREGPSPLAISAKRRSSGSGERERRSPLAAYGSVRISGPLSVITIECSNWAESEPSAVRT